MARKLDLFALLAEKQRRSKADTEVVGEPPARRRPGGAEDSLGAWLRAQWARLSAFVAPAAARARVTRPRARGESLHIGALGLSAVVFVALGAGFLLGRTLGAPSVARADDPALHAGPAKPRAEAPRWLREPSAPPEKEDEVLSGFAMPVLLFPAPRGLDSAVRLATYLRAHGVASARVREFPHTKNPAWGAVVYVPTVEAGPDYLEDLAKVAPPDFAPELADKVALLRGMQKRGELLIKIER